MISQFQRTRVNLLTLIPWSCAVSRAIRSWGAEERCSRILHCQTVTWFVRTQLPSSGLQQPECDRKHYWKFSHTAFSSSGALPLAGWRLKAGNTARIQPVLRIKIPFSFSGYIYLWRGHFHQLDQELFPSGKQLKMFLLAVGCHRCWGTGLMETQSFRDVVKVKSLNYKTYIIWNVWDKVLEEKKWKDLNLLISGPDGHLKAHEKELNCRLPRNFWLWSISTDK